MRSLFRLKPAGRMGMRVSGLRTSTPLAKQSAARQTRLYHAALKPAAGTLRSTGREPVPKCRFSATGAFGNARRLSQKAPPPKPSSSKSELRAYRSAVSRTPSTTRLSPRDASERAPACRRGCAGSSPGASSSSELLTLLRLVSFFATSEIEPKRSLSVVVATRRVFIAPHRAPACNGGDPCVFDPHSCRTAGLTRAANSVARRLNLADLQPVPAPE